MLHIFRNMGKKFLLIFIFFLFSCYYLHIFDIYQIFHSNKTADSHPKDNLEPFPGNSHKHLYVFVQLSDIHISKFVDTNRTHHLIEFCKSTLSQIQPTIVLVSGDLTDAKFKNFEMSGQIESEWVDYRKIINNCYKYIPKNTSWLDIRGNHDMFNVYNPNSKNNYFIKYSQQGRLRNYESYVHHLKYTSDHDYYRFIAIDLTMKPGLRRPFNFMGEYNDNNKRDVENLLNNRNQKFNHTFIFGHYPSSAVVNKNSFLNVLESASIYFCGHLHSFHGYIDAMFARHSKGNLELELSDWKQYRRYRIVAIDNDLISIFDGRHGYDNMILMILNPKNAQHIISSYEPIGRIRKSSHIRILLYYNKAKIHIKIFIDEEYIGNAQQNKENDKLYTLKWNPLKYSKGFHKIRASVFNNDDLLQSFEQDFSVDGTIKPFTIFQQIMIKNHVIETFILYFLCLIVSIFVSFLFYRCVFSSEKDCVLFNATARYNRQFWLFCRSKKISYIVLIHMAYFCIGPWFYAELLDDHYGWCFMYCIYIDGKVLMTGVTYLFATIHFFTYYIPLIVYLGMEIEYRTYAKRPKSCLSSKIIKNTIFCFIELYLIYTVYYRLYLCYGIMTLFGPYFISSFMLPFICLHLLSKRTIV